MILPFAYAAIQAQHASAQLQARPHVPYAAARAAVGDHEFEGSHIYVPRHYRPDRPAGVLVILHGADETAAFALDWVRRDAERDNVIVVAPKSTAASWDIVLGHFGPDVALIDRALGRVFARYAVDPGRIAIGGFSDGASYALTLGLENGGLFRTILALSPGFQAAPHWHGHPRVFVAHGTKDPILPIDLTSRRLVPRLEEGGRLVEYVEFDGEHEVLPEIVTQAFEWWRG